MAYSKAKIFIYKGAQKTLVDSMDVCFNPETYSVTTSNSISDKGAASGETQVLANKPGIYSQELKFKLFFDTYEARTSVKAYTDRLLALIMVDETQAPNICKFVWGKFAFEGIVSTITQDFMMFLEDGTPVRAEMNITVKADKFADEGESSEGNNSNTQSTDITDLMATALSQYGDSSKWKSIAKENNVDNPRA